MTLQDIVTTEAIRPDIRRDKPYCDPAGCPSWDGTECKITEARQNYYTLCPPAVQRMAAALTEQHAEPSRSARVIRGASQSPVGDALWALLQDAVGRLERGEPLDGQLKIDMDYLRADDPA